MSALTFSCNFGPDEMDQIDVPVEVRSENLSLVGRTLASQSIELDAGTYHVTARMPSGDYLYGQVVIEGSDTTAQLYPESGTKSPDEWHVQTQYLRVKRAPTPDASVGVGDESDAHDSSDITARLRLVQGNVLSDDFSIVSSDSWFTRSRETADEVQLTVDGVDQPRYVQVLQPDAPILNIAVPCAYGSQSRLVVTREPDTRYLVDVSLAHRVADLLVRYRARGYLQEITTATGSLALDAESLLQQKAGDPIAAAVGAYALLQIGELDRLHNWTENLYQWFEWLPDGVVIRAEHLARLGRHDEALIVLLDLPTRGLPMFTGGFSYADDRLRLYVDHGTATLNATNVARAREVLDQLLPYTPYVDYREVMLTFAGMSPDRPSDEPPDDQFWYEDGVDLNTYFR